MSEPFEPGREFAVALDRRDPLARFRSEFHVPKRSNGEEEIYFAGNSLGLLPRRTKPYVDAELEKWERLGVKAHFSGANPWMPYHELLAGPVARLVGAEASEVVTMNSLTVNLHLMMTSFYRPTPERHRILIEDRAFPSDDYAVESHAASRGLDPASTIVRLRPNGGRPRFEAEEIAEFLAREGSSIALVLLPGVQYYTGQVFGVAAITRLAHEKGCVVGWDLAHAAGNVPLKLHEWEVDFAVWCTYKYLNAGPGSVGGCFVHERHGTNIGEPGGSTSRLPRLSGWWGHDKESRFQMRAGFRPIPGAEGWQLSNPPIVSLAAIRAALEIFDEAGGIGPLRKKSIRLTGYLEWLLKRELGDSVEIFTPADPEQRGCQLSLNVKGKTPGKTVFQKIESAGVTCDWREPNVIRVAPVPLYNRYDEVWRFVEILRGAI